MSFFDLFNKEDRTKTEKRRQNLNSESPLEVFYPSSYKDVEKIIDSLRRGKTVMVHLNSLNVDTKNRIIDMLSGAVYALCGGLYETEKNSDIFIVSPSGVMMNK